MNMQMLEFATLTLDGTAIYPDIAIITADRVHSFAVSKIMGRKAKHPCRQDFLLSGS